MDTRLPAKKIATVKRCFEHKHADERFYALADELLWKNAAAVKFLESDRALMVSIQPPDLGSFFSLPMDFYISQLAFGTLVNLDIQVPNGGLLQFFWNCPRLVDHTPGALRLMDLTELAEAFERSTAGLMAQIGTYSEFRIRNSLEAYSQCAGEFSFEDFDSAYFKCGEQVYAKTTEYISDHLAEFVQ